MRNFSRQVLFFILFICLFAAMLNSAAAADLTGLPPQLEKMLNSGQFTEKEINRAGKFLRNKQMDPNKLQEIRSKVEEGRFTDTEIKAGRDLLGKEGQEAVGVGDDAIGRAKPDGSQEDGEVADEIDSDTDDGSFFTRIFGPELPADLQLFGMELFTQPRETFGPVSGVPVSQDYVVGPGDVIEILMWGRLDATYSLEVDNEGVLNFPQIGPLTVAGLTFRQLTDLIKHKAEAITGVNVSVSMGKLRTFQVFVLGEVQKPGVHTINSLSTAVHALLAAGGPTMLGSLRNLQVKRKGSDPVTIDLYDFLLQGDISKDCRLMPGDVVFLPQAGPLVAVSGNVKRPAIYELKESSTLFQLLSLAGGLAPRADNQRVQISRADANQLEVVLDIPYEQLSEDDDLALQDGDIINVFPIITKVENAVYLVGNVKHPGKYAYEKGLQLADLLPDLESLEDDTYLEYGLIKRYHLDRMDFEFIPFDLGRMFAEGDKNPILLQPLDEIIIYSRWQFEDMPQATISGEVRTPGTYEIRRQTVRDLIYQAGNLTPDAYLKLGHLYRTDRYTKEVSILVFNVAEAMAGNPAHNFQLQNFDRVEIHSAWEYAEEYSVSAQGMVNNPGVYPYAANMKVRDLIMVAGNIKESAFLDDAEVVRSTIVDGREVQTTLININLRLALAGDSGHNIKLQPWDVVTVKQVPEWGESRQVTILGEVSFPGTYTIRQDEKISSLIARAGGFTDDAYFGGARFIRESVRSRQQEWLDELVNRLSEEMSKVAMDEMSSAVEKADIEAGKQIMTAQQVLIDRLRQVKAEGRVVITLAPGPAFERSAHNLVLEDADTLYIPSKPETVSIAGEVYNPTSLIYNPEESRVSYYLAQVGGPTGHADIDQMYIIRANGTVFSASQAAGFGASLLSDFNDVEIYPGDTLVVPPKLIQVSWRREMMDISKIFYEIAVSAGILITQVFN
jgi:protein involved in polysaccharide export with SLBB domain